MPSRKGYEWHHPFDDFQEPASFPLVIHVWSFSAWMGLLALQAYVAGTRRLEWHRKLGLAMLPLAAVMVWAGVVSEMQFQQRVLENGRDSTDFFAVTATLLPLAWHTMCGPEVVCTGFTVLECQVFSRFTQLPSCYTTALDGQIG